MAALRVAAPDAGAYVNECDYFQEDWQHAFWGPNYPRLARIKRRYDPDGLFTVHHGVGSEPGARTASRGRNRAGVRQTISSVHILELNHRSPGRSWW